MRGQTSPGDRHPVLPQRRVLSRLCFSSVDFESFPLFSVFSSVSSSLPLCISLCGSVCFSLCLPVSVSVSHMGE